LFRVDHIDDAVILEDRPFNTRPHFNPLDKHMANRPKRTVVEPVNPRRSARRARPPSPVGPRTRSRARRGR
jgi:hypothetical protein